MEQKFMSKHEVTTSVVAVMVAAALLLGGTFAWQSISQQALNEVASTVNPGGRLHDDFVDVTYGADEIAAYDVMTFDKDVYAENFTSLANNGVQIYARVRLDEYMEFGKNAGAEIDNEATPLVAGTNLTDKDTWSTYRYGEDSAYREYFEMSFGGKTVYMPTFNKDMNSLVADINGTFKANFNDYTDYELNDTKTADAVYAAIDDEGNNTTKTIEETHTAKETHSAYVISMEDYIVAVEAGTLEGAAFDGTGDFWVYDSDGWAYWANPIDPENATGLLLNGINRTETIINNDWYYAINVVAQFITYDDMGAENGTGFYDTTAGTVPSVDALDLLNIIGVDVNYKVSNEAELATALAKGGTVTLNEDITITEALTVSKDTVLNLGDKKITYSGENDIFDEETKVWSLISVDGANLIINGNGTVEAKANDSFCIDVQNGGKVVINGGNYVGNISAVYVYSGEAAIYGGNFSIEQTSGITNKNYTYVLNCYNDNYKNGTAKITVCGGTFENFDPSAENAGDDGSYVKNGYVVTNSDNTYTVTKK